MAAQIEEGETFVSGASKENARALLDAAEASGLDAHVVRYVTEGGFVVPTEVAELAFPPKKQTAAQKKAAEKEND